MKSKTAIISVLTFFFTNHSVKSQGTYTGTGSVTQGLATTTATNLFPGCAGGRITAVGTINSTDGKAWVVPAETNFTSATRLPDLYNQCSGVMPANIGAVNLNSLPVKVIDNAGDTITAYIFGDNYFELYINGVLVGVDPVPYTPFNSCVVKFKVSRPYTIAVKLVDWEENMGVGTENNNGNLYHAGDGGFIAQFSDGTVTDDSWKAQTFYIAPIQNLSTVVELPDSTRSSATASTSPSCNGACYGIHYTVPSTWNTAAFNDQAWPHATTYTAATVGVNFPAYTNFSGVWNNAKFIWSSNLILDNLVLIRKTVGSVVLPLSIISVNASLMGNGVQIKWTTANEINISHFIIERSVSGNNWESIFQINATNTNVLHEYSITDNSPVNGISYYRLKSIEEDGKISYSAVQVIRLNNSKSQVNIFPNPSHNEFSFQLSNMIQASDIQQINIFSNTGQLVLSVNGFQQKVSTSKFAKGMYTVIIKTTNNTITQKLMIE